MSRLLLSKLADVRRRSILVRSGTGLCLGICAAIGFLLATMFVDWMVDLPYAVRAAMLALNLLVAGFILTRYAVFPALFAPDDDELALRVERWQPQFRTRLIASVQLARADAAATSPSLLRALIGETERMADAIPFAQVVRPDPLLRSGGVTLAVILATLIGFGYGRAVAVPLLQRALLVPNVEVPRKTRVLVTSGDAVIARGEGVTLSATAAGVVPDAGTALIEYAAGQTLQFAMPPLPEQRDQFARRIDNVQDSFTYRVRLNDGTSKPHTVTVTERPAVSDIKIRQTYPAYTNLGTVSRSPGDLDLLAGSRLHLDITANKPVRATAPNVRAGNYLRLEGSGLELPLVVNADNPSRLSVVQEGKDGFVPPPETTGFSMHLVDEYGLRSVDPVVYRVQVRPDAPPTVRVTYPERREELVTQQGAVIVGFDATDDFALGRLALRYKVRNPESGPAEASDGDGDGLSATYFNQVDFQGRQVKRIDPRVDFNWGGGSPAPGIGADEFSVRWEGQVQPRYDERYSFIMRADDACRLWVNDQLLIDQFPGNYQQEFTASIALQANVKYNIRVEMAERGSIAEVHLWWASPSQARQIIPQSRLFSATGEARSLPPEPAAAQPAHGDGVKIAYFSKDDLSGKEVQGTLANIDIAWQEADRPKGIPEKFSARMTGFFIPRHSGLYTIRTQTDDGIRFWIDDKLLIDEWAVNAREQSVVASLEAGEVYAFKYEYNNRGGSLAEARLRWQSDLQIDEPIPQDRLFTARDKALSVKGRIARLQSEQEARQAAIQQDDPDARTIVLDMGGTPKSLRGRYQFELSGIAPQPAIGSIVEWWVQAIDTNNVTGPGKAVSDHYLARVVTPDVKRADLLSQAADAFDRMRGVTENQEQLNERLGGLLLGHPEPPP